MKKSVLKQYARLIAVKGAGIQKGQEVVIRCGLDQIDFITILTEECYKAGAAKVSVEFNHQAISKLHYKYRTLKNLSKVENWEIEKLKHRVEKLPALIYIDSEDPDGMKGVNQVKVSKSNQAIYPITKPYRDAMEGKYQWCIAAVPGEKWAKKVFPNDRKSVAMEKLWDAILKTARADGNNPVEDWNNHNKNLQSRCDYLNSLGIAKLKYSSSNGTDFEVGLIDNGIFIGGCEKTPSGVEYNPNMPSEEVFTSPMKGKAEGIVYSTKPLSYRGELIEDFSITFKDGKAVDCSAKKNEDLLKDMISMDEGAAYLGECSLIPYDSPIRNTEITFFNTLFDENACCHLALGMGFMECIKDHNNYSLEEVRDMGINDSQIHVDFMIGSVDMKIDAITKEGKIVPIFRDGNWAF
ncbi:MAG: aminopeptidase [Clostridia bacterium]|nr:aminopeptidase [Clostridia bacterium]